MRPPLTEEELDDFQKMFDNEETRVLRILGGIILASVFVGFGVVIHNVYCLL